MRIGYLQFRPLFGQVKQNLERIIRSLSGVEADLIVLPELAFTGYHFANRQELLALAETTESATVERLVELCNRTNMRIVTGFAERADDRIFNSALLIDSGGVLAVYRKLHLFNNEKHYFDPGDRPLTVQQIPGARVGMMVCFDWAFPEVARTLTMLGAEVLVHPSNLVLGYCQQAMLTRCLENRVYAVTANRIGADVRPHGSLRFTGKSQITAPDGVALHRGPAQRQECMVMEIDLTVASNKRITPLNDVLLDRRPEFYFR